MKMLFFFKKDKTEEVKEFESKSQMILGVAIFLWNLAVVFFCGTLFYQLSYSFLVTMIEGSQNWLAMLGVLLILLAFFMGFIFLVLKLINSGSWFNFLEISKKYIYTYQFPFLRQKIKIQEIKSIDIYWQQNYLFFRKTPLLIAIGNTLYANGRFENFEYFKLKINKTKGKSIFLKYAINNLGEAEEIKEYILNPKVVKKENEIEKKHEITETRYNINFFSEKRFFSGKLLFLTLLVILVSFLVSIQLGQRMLFVRYLIYVFIGVLALIQLYIILYHTKIKKVEITKFHIKEHRVGLPFKHRFFVKKEEIELLRLAQNENKYQIKVITKTGDIHELPIDFGTKEAGEEQLMKIKKMMKLT